MGRPSVRFKGADWEQGYRGAAPGMRNGTRRDAPAWGQHRGPGHSLGTGGLGEVVGSEVAPQEGWDPLPGSEKPREMPRRV